MQVCLLGTIKNKDVAALQEYLLNTDHNVSTISPSESEKDVVDRYQVSKKTVATCDVVMAHVSVFDEGNAYHLAVALDSKKYVLLLVPSGDSRNEEILRIQDSQLRIAQYSDNKGIRTAVDGFFAEMMNKLDAKLFMVIPPSVNKYLDWVLVHTEKSKSDVVRAAVEGVASKDEEYQSFLSKSSS